MFVKKLLLILCFSLGSTNALAEYCTSSAYTAGLITNFRMSEGSDLPIQAFEKWWIKETGASIPLQYYTIAMWVWENDLVVPIDAYDKYIEICIDRTKKR